MSASAWLSHTPPCGAAPPRVRVADNRKGFVLEGTASSFTPWGLNYGRPGQLLEDFWETDWQGVEQDFQEMKSLGANVVRVHLQLGKFMVSAEEVDARALERLVRLLELAEKTELYLDITGLGCYRPADVPPWYDKLGEADRWAVQARFWEAVAKRCASSPAVFCYDLMNEPLSPGGKRDPGNWYSGKLFGGFDFLQFISLDQAERPREDIAHAWIKTLAAAIRKHDRRTLITVGLLPWSRQWRHLSGFLPEKVGPELDFVSVHIYPEGGKIDEALEGLAKFDVGKPVVIEETFPLACGTEDLEEFLKRSREHACGWIGHYAGSPLGELNAAQQRKELSMADALMMEWLKLFKRLGPVMTQREGPGQEFERAK